VSLNCDDSDACTTNTCINGACTSTTLSCDDKVNCTIDTCDPKTGCSHKPDNSVCSTPDPCVINTCDLTKGCITKNFTCTPTGKQCLTTSCIAYQGCVNESLVCPSSNKSCTFTSCSEDNNNKPCKTENLNCAAAVLDTTVIAATATAVSAAVIAAIVAAAVLFGGVATGASIAIYRKNNDDGMANVINNPIYTASTSSGMNPLAKTD
jgi:hypothetical protein